MNTLFLYVIIYDSLTYSLMWIHYRSLHIITIISILSLYCLPEESVKVLHMQWCCLNLSLKNFSVVVCTSGELHSGGSVEFPFNLFENVIRVIICSYFMLSQVLLICYLKFVLIHPCVILFLQKTLLNKIKFGLMGVLYSFICFFIC